MLKGTSWEILDYRWYQQILGCEDVKAPFNMQENHCPPILHPPACYPPRSMYMGQRISPHPPASPRILHSSSLLYKILVFVPCFLLVRRDPFSSSLYKGLCKPGVLTDFLFNKKGKMQDKLADRNPPWSETRSQRSQCEEVVPAWKLYLSISK